MKLLKYFLFILPLVALISCDKEKDEEEEMSLPAAAYYFQGEIEGETVSFEQARDGFYSGTTSSGGFAAEGDVQAKDGTLIAKIDLADLEAEGPYFAIDVRKTFPGQSSVDIEDRMTMYEKNVYDYSSEEGEEDGVVISYTEDGDKLWYSSWGSQTNSMFEITEVVENASSDSFLIFAATFNCTLYDNEGNSMELKNGTYRGLAVNY